MLRRTLASSRYMMLVVVVGSLAGSLALILYEMIVLVMSIINAIGGAISPKEAKAFAVGLIEAVDVFLIAIALYIISVGTYSLFIDDSLPMPRWLEVHDLEDLKSNLVSVVIAVLAVLFLREAVLWEPGRDLPAYGAALALIVSSLTFFLFVTKRRGKQRPTDKGL